VTSTGPSGKLRDEAATHDGSSASRFSEVRRFTTSLTVPLTSEDQTVQSMPDVSPTKWHLAHTTWFFEAFVLGRFARGYEPFHPAYSYLFNSYYEAVGPRHARSERGLLTRPGVDEIVDYRAFVDAKLLDLLASGDHPDELGSIMEIGLNHEQQHQELLLMDIKHVLSCNPLDPSYEVAANRTPSVARPLGWVDHDGGLVSVGHDGDGFAFDNEGPHHRTYVHPFAVADRPVTCGEWLAFMADGGYERSELWLSDGWATVRDRGWKAPSYWHQDEAGEWSTFTLYGREPIDPDAPVSHISFYEADAYAHWSGWRLPSEVEWELAIGPTAATDKRTHGLEPITRSVDHAPTASGEVWEWTGSAYLPYPGYRAPAGAIGEYNGKFMVNQHVLRGSACITSPGHDRSTYRNFFPPVSRWPYAGLRVARDS
jgi:ergothioneine biosynthesis protein EgtB